MSAIQRNTFLVTSEFCRVTSPNVVHTIILNSENIGKNQKSTPNRFKVCDTPLFFFGESKERWNTKLCAKNWVSSSFLRRESTI